MLLHLCRPSLPGCGRQIQLVAHSASISAALSLTGVNTTYRVIALPIRRERRQQVPRVVCDPILQHYASPVGYIWIVSEGEYTGGREFGRKERLRPRLGRVLGGPRLVAITGKAVHEDDAEKNTLAGCPFNGSWIYTHSISPSSR